MPRTAYHDRFRSASDQARTALDLRNTIQAAHLTWERPWLFDALMAANSSISVLVTLLEDRYEA